MVSRNPLEDIFQAAYNKAGVLQEIRLHTAQRRESHGHKTADVETDRPIRLLLVTRAVADGEYNPASVPQP